MRAGSLAREIAVLGMVALSGACARQAIVGSEPGRGRSAAVESLRSDLTRLARDQASYFSRRSRYAATLEDLPFAPSPGVSLSIIQGDRNGFSAIASSGDQECALYDGGVRSPRSYATRPGVVACRG
ncbi:MAG: hypothetical protein ACE5HF_01660 [Gemmatimonadota bacterium]